MQGTTSTVSANIFMYIHISMFFSFVEKNFYLRRLSVLSKTLLFICVYYSCLYTREKIYFQMLYVCVVLCSSAFIFFFSFYDEKQFTNWNCIYLIAIEIGYFWKTCITNANFEYICTIYKFKPSKLTCRSNKLFFFQVCGRYGVPFVYL